MNPLEHSL